MRPCRFALGVLVGAALASGCKPPPPPVVNATPPPPPQPVQMEQVKVGVGVGIKGRSLDGESGIIVTPVKSYFAAKEKIAFEIAVPQAISLYKALNGSLPQTTDEFMELVIKANNIKLPELPQGHRYVWNAETEELMVERPAQQQTPGAK